MVRSTSMILFALLVSVSGEESTSMLQLLSRHEQRQETSSAADQTLSQLEKSLQGKKKDNIFTEKSAGQTCTCAFTSSHRNSCCSSADNKGMNTGNFCGNYRRRLTCNTTTPTCCTSMAGDAHCCKAGASCSAGCLNGGSTNGESTGVSLGVCGCLNPPPESEASTLYDEDMAQAMADLASATSCSYQRYRVQVSFEDIPKVYERYRCPSCNVAGFELEEGTVHSVVEQDGKDEDALFIFVARARSLQADSTVQDGDCIVSVRGTANAGNWGRNFQFNFRNEEEPDQAEFNEAGACEGCGIHLGYSRAYHILKPGVVTALNTLGCGAGTGQPVYATGHSMGAALATLFIYDLQNVGFNMALSYVFESPRMGNGVFAQNFRNAFKPRNVPMFRITNMRDLIVHTPFQNENGKGGGYTHVGAEVYYGPAWDGETDAQYRYTICDEDDDVRCANRYNAFDALANPNRDHLVIPLLKGGSFGVEQDWCKAVKNECYDWEGNWRC